MLRVLSIAFRFTSPSTARTSPDSANLLQIAPLAVFRDGKILIIDNGKKYASLVSVAHEGTSLSINECTEGLVFGAYLESGEIDPILEAGGLDCPIPPRDASRM